MYLLAIHGIQVAQRLRRRRATRGALLQETSHATKNHPNKSEQSCAPDSDQLRQSQNVQKLFAQYLELPEEAQEEVLQLIKNQSKGAKRSADQISDECSREVKRPKCEEDSDAEENELTETHDADQSLPTRFEECADPNSASTSSADDAKHLHAQVEAGVSLVRHIDDLSYSEKYKDKLVMINSGHCQGIALMLSAELCDKMLASLDGNREAYNFLSQRQTNLDSRNFRDQGIVEYHTRLEAQYQRMKKACLMQPQPAYIHAMLAIKERQEEFVAVREGFAEDDKQELERTDQVYADQRQTDAELANTLDDAFVFAGLRSEFDAPCFNDRVPDWNHDVLYPMDFEGVPNNLLDGDIDSSVEERASPTSLEEGDTLQTHNVEPENSSDPTIYNPLGTDQEYGTKLRNIPDIGLVMPYALDEWAPLLQNQNDLRADVWKYQHEIEGAESEIEELQIEREELEETTELLEEQLENDIASEDRNQRLEEMDRRAHEVTTYLRLCEIRHEIAKYRARWMGCVVDDKGALLDPEDSDLDVDIDDAKAIDSEARDARIHAFIENVTPGFEEVVDTPDLDEWDAGAEIRVWDNPTDRDDEEYWWSCKEYFQNRETCACALGA